MPVPILPLEDVEKMWEAYKQRPTVHHVWKITGKPQATIRHYVKVGDLRRQIAPFEVRYKRMIGDPAYILPSALIRDQQMEQVFGATIRKLMCYADEFTEMGDRTGRKVLEFKPDVSVTVNQLIELAKYLDFRKTPGGDAPLDGGVADDGMRLKSNLEAVIAQMIEKLTLERSEEGIKDARNPKIWEDVEVEIMGEMPQIEDKTALSQEVPSFVPLKDKSPEPEDVSKEDSAPQAYYSPGR